MHVGPFGGQTFAVEHFYFTTIYLLTIPYLIVFCPWVQNKIIYKYMLSIGYIYVLANFFLTLVFQNFSP